MPSWSPSRSGCAPPYVRATPWPGSAGTSSSYLAEGVSAVEDQAALAARVQAVLDQSIQVGGREVRSGASIGVAIAGPDADARSVLREADAAMYRAKARGRGRYELSHESPVGARGAT